METPVKFENNNQQLFGIVHQPDSDTATRDTGIVFLHGWATYRIGPHRLFVDAARRFTDAGFPCLRFDFRGRGESEGTTMSFKLLDMIDDAREAVEFMVSKTSVKNVILLGLCSGGEVAVGAAMSHPLITGLILWSTPLLARQSDLSTDLRKSHQHAKTYWYKLFNRETWKKMISLQINYRAVFKTIFGHFHHNRKKSVQESDLLKKFNSFAGKILFVYGGNDPISPFSTEKYKEICDDNKLEASFHTIKEANHNFYSLKWKQELLDISDEWLKAME